MKTNNRQIGELHSNGKWAWTEYSEGKFDWRTIKNGSEKPEELKKEEPATSVASSDSEEKAPLSFVNKKSFINHTERDLTEEECKYYYRNYGKVVATVRNSWTYFQGKIGSTKQTFSQCGANDEYKKEKDFNNHPDWRPLAICNYSFQGYRERVQVECVCQSWEEIRDTFSDTEDQTFYIVKHPHQY